MSDLVQTTEVLPVLGDLVDVTRSPPARPPSRPDQGAPLTRQTYASV